MTKFNVCDDYDNLIWWFQSLVWLFNRLKSDQNLSSALDKHRRFSRE